MPNLSSVRVRVSSFASIALIFWSFKLDENHSTRIKVFIHVDPQLWNFGGSYVLTYWLRPKILLWLMPDWRIWLETDKYRYQQLILKKLSFSHLKISRNLGKVTRRRKEEVRHFHQGNKQIIVCSAKRSLTKWFHKNQFWTIDFASNFSTN